MKRCATVLALGLAWGCTSPGRRPRLAETGPKPQPIAPPAPAAIEQAIGRGLEFLLREQNPNGSWGSARRTKALNIYAPVPGAHHAFRAAVTGLCVSALIETGSRDERVQQAIARGETWLLTDLRRLRRANQSALYNVWGHAYAIQALVRLHAREPSEGKRRELRDVIADQVGFLERYESVDGGWGYYDFGAHTRKPHTNPTSFMTATVLIALWEAEQIGVQAPRKLLDRALACVRHQRNPDFSYLYSANFWIRPAYPINRPGGSLGRSQACNAALRLWGDEAVTDAVLKTWLDRLAARNGWLSMGRKRPVPHESWMQVAGYFFYYGHYYAGYCIELLPTLDRPHFQHHLAAILLALQEKDGSWWDYPLYNYHQPYGTAMALMALVRCRPAAARSGRIAVRRGGKLTTEPPLTLGLAEGGSAAAVVARRTP